MEVHWVLKNWVDGRTVVITGVKAGRDASLGWILSVRFEIHPGVDGEGLMSRWSLSAAHPDGEPLADRGFHLVRAGDDSSAAVGRWVFSSLSESAPTAVVLHADAHGDSEAQSLEMAVRLAADGEDLDEETGAPQQDGAASLRMMASHAFEALRSGPGLGAMPTFESPALEWTDGHELLAQDLIGSLSWTRSEAEAFLRNNQGGSLSPTEAAMEAIQEAWIDTSWPECLRHGQHPMTLRAADSIRTGYPFDDPEQDDAEWWWACPHTGELLCRMGRLGVDHPYPPRFQPRDDG